jgi:hypothetical protein
MTKIKDNRGPLPQPSQNFEKACKTFLFIFIKIKKDTKNNCIHPFHPFINKPYF